MSIAISFASSSDALEAEPQTPLVFDWLCLADMTAARMFFLQHRQALATPTTHAALLRWIAEAPLPLAQLWLHCLVWLETF